MGGIWRKQLFVVDKANPVPYTRGGKAIRHPCGTAKILVLGLGVVLPIMVLLLFAVLRACLYSFFT